MKHVLSVEQFDHEQFLELFELADQFREQVAIPDQRRELAGRYVGHQLAAIFYEPSLRTRVTFEKAGHNFGMGVVSSENAREFSSAAKGESIEDTIRVMDEYGFDVIALRHDETGSLAKAAALSETPLINGGDGKGEHPTQALLDAHTIYRKFGRLDNLHVVIGGDLEAGRTARSLAKLLAGYPGNKMSFVSIPELRMREDIKNNLTENGIEFEETGEMHDVFRSADVVYWTRMQKERVEVDKSQYKTQEEIDEAIAAKREYLIQAAARLTIDTTALQSLPEEAIIMHPLPRVGEISEQVDADPRALFFKQAGNGLYIRMALIDKIMRSK